jgi:hypothetical protein
MMSASLRCRHQCKVAVAAVTLGGDDVNGLTPEEGAKLIAADWIPRDRLGHRETLRKHDSSVRARTRRASDATDGQNASIAHLNQRKRPCYVRQPRSSAMPPGAPRRPRLETGMIPLAITAITAAPPATAANVSSTPAAGRARHRSIYSDFDPARQSGAAGGAEPGIQRRRGEIPGLRLWRIRE